MPSGQPNPSALPALETAYIALGSNLPSPVGDPVATLRAAIVRLEELGTVTAQSSLYETEPVGPVLQPAFVNAVVGLRTEFGPQALLQRLLSLERDFGRDRAHTPPKGPRSLDLDILLMGDVVLVTPELTLPHPAMAERRFVLAPLAEIAPELIHPVWAKTIAALLSELPDAGSNSVTAVRSISPVGQVLS